MAISLVFALPDHPWVESVDGAADVRVAMTVAQLGKVEGVLSRVVSEQLLAADDVMDVVLEYKRGFIQADLRLGPAVSKALPLVANARLTSMGVMLAGRGFLVDSGKELIAPEGIIRPIVNGDDLTGVPRRLRVIDFADLGEDEARRKAPEPFQYLLDRVKPMRDANRDRGFRESWWRFGRTRPHLRELLNGLKWYIATSETAKHRVFVKLPAEVLPEHKLVVIGVDDDFVFGSVSAKPHLVWALAAGGRLEDRPVYTKTLCFDPYPFPAGSTEQENEIRRLGRTLNAHRKHRQELHPRLTITAMYNVLEKLRLGEPLDEKERVVHEQGLVSVLKQIHDDLDVSVFNAYGWPATLSDEEILDRLVELNHERHEEEQRGVIHWLRPEFQNPQGTKSETQISLVDAGLAVPAPAKGKGKRPSKPAWPKDLPARVVAVRDLLAETGGVTASDFPHRFKGVKAAEAEKLLESLAAVGVAIETSGPGAERSWRLLR